MAECTREKFKKILDLYDQSIGKPWGENGSNVVIVPQTGCKQSGCNYSCMLCLEVEGKLIKNVTPYESGNCIKTQET